MKWISRPFNCDLKTVKCKYLRIFFNYMNPKKLTFKNKILMSGLGLSEKSVPVNKYCFINSL